MTVPTQLLNDMADRLRRLSDDDLLCLHSVYAAQPDDGVGTIGALAQSLRRAIEREHHRRVTGQAFRLDDVAAAVQNLYDGDIRTGKAVHAGLARTAVLPASQRAWHAVIGQMLMVEGSQRRAEFRLFERDATSDRAAGWWGSSDPPHTLDPSGDEPVTPGDDPGDRPADDAEWSP